MTLFQIHPFLSFNLAVILLLVGKAMTLRIGVLQRYAVPEPVAGGLLCVSVTALAWAAFDLRIQFDLGVRDLLLLVFFAGIGLKSDLPTLLAGGRPLIIMLIPATAFTLLQNVTGIAVATAFGEDGRAELMVGSVALTGGVGTTLAWAPTFAGQYGIANALELGIASNTVGLIAATLVGGPVAAWLIRTRKIQVSRHKDLDIGAPNMGRVPKIDYFSILWAVLALNLVALLGAGLHRLIEAAGITLPAFVSCLMVGIVLRNLLPQSRT